MKPYFSNGNITIYHAQCEDVVRLLPDNSFGAIITDPPFSMGTEWVGEERIAGHAAREFMYRYDFVRLLRSVFGRAFIFTNPVHGYVCIDRLCETLEPENFYPDEQAAPQQLGIHPHARPVEFVKWLLRYTNGGVFDPFMGSGTTLLAAQRLERKAVGVDINEKYCEMAAERLTKEL
jgi:site-specific DNA-methyltransferase (adenine-specific)